MERCFSRALASLEPRCDAVDLCIGSTEQIGETQPIVVDNWGSLFDEIPAPDATFTTVLKDIKPEESLLVEYPHQIEKGEEKLQVAPLEEALSKCEVGKRTLARPPRLLASLFAPATDAALDSELSGTTGQGASLDALDRDSLAQPAREFVVGDVSAPRPPRLRPPWRAPPRRPWRSPRPTRLRRPRRAPPRPPWLRGRWRAPPRPPWRARRRRRAAGMEARHPFRPGLRLRRPQGPPRRPHYRGVPAPTLLPPPPRDAATASPIPTPREASSQVLAAAWRKSGAHSVHAARVFDEMSLCHQPLSASVPTVFTFQCAALPSAAVFHARTAVRGAALSSVGRQGLAIIHDTSALQAEELLSCGGDFTNSCDFNLIGAPVVFVRSCDENMVNLRLLSSSDWVEQQPWPPPPMQVASVCSSAAIRPTPWPPPECIEAMNQDIFATSQESVHCSAYVQNFCQELIYLGIYTRGQVTVIPILSRGQGFQFRMLNENEFRDAVLLVFANKQDLPIAMNATEIPRKLGLHSIRQRHWYIQNTCATAVNFYSLAVEDDLPATTLCANRSLCWLQLRKGNRALSNAPLCIVMCSHWSKACHRQGAALNFLKDCKEVVHAFEQALKHARAKSQRTLHMHAPKCLTTDLIALIPWKFWPWLGSYTSDMFRKLRVLWSPRVWGCSSALMLTSSVLLGALLVAQLVSLVFCWELMLQYNADFFELDIFRTRVSAVPLDPGGSMLLHWLGGKPSLITATRDVMLIVNWQLLALVLPACFVQLQRGGLTEFDSNSYSHEFSISLWELLAVMKSISYMEILLSIF